jgi:plastocyanin
MKPSNSALRRIPCLAACLAAGFVLPSAFADASIPVPASKQSGRPGPITIVDRNGRQVPNSVPSVHSQIFDVMVGPNGKLMFSPDVVNISVGDTVRWTWFGTRHSVTSGQPCTPDNQFCSPDDMNCAAGMTSDIGAVYQHTFAQAGAYSYFCSTHCFFGMTGTINVAEALQVTSAVSRKSHPSAPATFDVDLPLTETPGIECRTGGATIDYAMVVTFSTSVTVNGNPQAQVTSGTATIGSKGVSNGGSVVVSGNVVTVPLTNVANAQTIQVTLNGVNGSANIVIPMSLLIGDTNANGAVNSGDVAQTKARIGQTLDATNFRSDVNANGAINAGDVSLIKSLLGTGLP